MRWKAFAGCLALLGLTLTAAPAQAHGHDPGRGVLGPRDGWAAATTGTTGGAAAAPGDVHVVTKRSELAAALAGHPGAPKIVYVRGTIEGNVDARDRPMSCADFTDPGYSLPAYLAAYDPATWGRNPVSGPLEEARARSQANQAAQVVLDVGSNTTVYGLGGATLHGLTLRVTGDNVILRNLRFADAHDCFPQWDPLDGADGNWNSEYDNADLAGATHVWVDHDEFSDGGNDTQPTYFGRKFEVHDGLLDIVNGSDLVTVSYNRLHDHDKTMLIGNTDKPTHDVGKLRVTVHHNLFSDVGQRAPRVRYGQVHVYDNLYAVNDPAEYTYSLGVGVESRIYAENNFFRIPASVPPGKLVKYWKGTVLHATGTLVSVDAGRPRPVDLLAEYNAANDPDLGPDVGWTPALVSGLDPAWAVPARVLCGAGPVF
ncbi:pectate lyase family protein [Amycolatopsis australiensis]|uniref:Pectate lyase n=1 Tax=Amycolatopsis australiensis TaxID=546364 RepID=A0A1K1SHH0_9PSEU|nr:pectate lyase [Amycolatopsis australiensis]SFW83714.1 pectate lyase [Amycolatopsis australiensis]